MDFTSEEKTPSGEPLAYGKFLDFGLLPYEEDTTDETSARQRELLRVLQQMKKGDNFNPPYVVMDLATINDISLQVEGKAYEDSPEGKVLSKTALENPALKLLMPANLICDLKSISADHLGGMSVIKCNPAVPIYRWFQAANMMLKYCDQKGRVIPFPMDQDDGTTFQMLRVDPREYLEYCNVLDHCVKQKGLEEGFATAAKFSYEVLSTRGINKMTHEQVDKTLTHVMLQENGRLHGILLHNAGREELATEELTRHCVYY